MNRIFEVFVKNRLLFRNIFVMFSVVLCGVMYCLFGRNIVFQVPEEGEELSLDESLQETGWHDEDIYKEIEESFNHIANNYVYICGYVVNPGVYICEAGTRLYEVIDMAGGFTRDADREALNLVSVVADGERIYVPCKGEVISADMSGGDFGGVMKININTAGVQALTTLPGIGEARALDIIAYRERHGRFERIEDIMKVSGIKEAAYQKIKNYIIV